MRKSFLFIAFVALFLNVKAIDPKAVMLEANNYYEKAQFDKAIDKYQDIIKGGFMSFDLYFNLGNAYYKTHDYKSAILYYEKAKLLKPGNKDVNFNLDLARANIVDKINPIPEVFFITGIKWIRNQVSADGWGILSTFTFIIALGLFLLYLLSGKLNLRKLGFWIGVVMLFLAITSFLMGFQLLQAQRAGNTAIVFTPSVTIKSSPSETGTNLFVLHEGTKVQILDRLNDWREIRIADGNRGWIKVSDIETI